MPSLFFGFGEAISGRGRSRGKRRVTRMFHAVHHWSDSATYASQTVTVLSTYHGYQRYLFGDEKVIGILYARVMLVVKPRIGHVQRLYSIEKRARVLGACSKDMGRWHVVNAGKLEPWTAGQRDPTNRSYWSHLGRTAWMNG